MSKQASSHGSTAKQFSLQGSGPHSGLHSSSLQSTGGVAPSASVIHDNRIIRTVVSIFMVRSLYGLQWLGGVVGAQDVQVWCKSVLFKTCCCGERKIKF